MRGFRKEDLNGSPECTLERTLRQMKSSLGIRMESSRSALSSESRLLSNGMRFGVSKMMSVPWQPKGDGVNSTAFVMPPDLGVKGRVKPPPGLSRVEEEEENETLEDLEPGQSETS